LKRLLCNKNNEIGKTWKKQEFNRETTADDKKTGLSNRETTADDKKTGLSKISLILANY
jgi:hypothetical protein